MVLVANVFYLCIAFHLLTEQHCVACIAEPAAEGVSGVVNRRLSFAQGQLGSTPTQTPSAAAANQAGSTQDLTAAPTVADIAVEPTAVPIPEVPVSSGSEDNSPGRDFKHVKRQGIQGYSDRSGLIGHINCDLLKHGMPPMHDRTAAAAARDSLSHQNEVPELTTNRKRNRSNQEGAIYYTGDQVRCKMAQSTHCNAFHLC